MPNIPRLNTINQAAQNDPVRNGNTIRQDDQEQQNTVHNRNTGRDTYTPSPAAQRMAELTDRNQVQNELNVVQQEQNPNEEQRQQAAAIRTEIEGINRETETMTAPEQNTTGNRVVDAMEQYQGQQQSIIRNQNNTALNNLGLLG